VLTLHTPSHPQAFLTPQYLAIAMEFASGGDMFEHVVRKGGLKESEARWFFQQLIVGVDYVHKMVREAATWRCVQIVLHAWCTRVADACRRICLLMLCLSANAGGGKPGHQARKHPS